MEESRSRHIIELAKELLDDIELNRISAEQLLLKASRLARWMGSEEIQQWLKLEMTGYDNSKVALKYMSITGRWTDREKGMGYWGATSPTGSYNTGSESQTSQYENARYRWRLREHCHHKCYKHDECDSKSYFYVQRDKKQGTCTASSIR